MVAPTIDTPTMLTFNAAGIPAELKDRRQWVCWKLVNRTNAKGITKATKQPINAITGRSASATDPATWATFADALAYWKQNRQAVSGVGFVFSGDDPYTGIDLDKVRDPATGALDPEAHGIITRFASYTEASISGTGVHIITRATMPAAGNRRGCIETYDRARFFVMSGHVLAEATTIEDRQVTYSAWHREVFAESTPEPTEVRAVAAPPATISDDDLRRRCLGNPRFGRLESGDDGDYDDDTSRADLAFCNILVRNGADREQVDAAYRRSGRFRPKWDERRGDHTYGEMTLDQAFDGTVTPFVAGQRPTAQTKPRPEPHLAGSLPGEVEQLRAIVIDLQARVIDLEEQVTAAKAEAAAEKARAVMLSEVQSKTARILGNKNLGQKRVTAVALSYFLANREAADDHGEDGFYPVWLPAIGKAAGVSDDSAGKHIAELADEGFLRKRRKFIPEKVDQETGEIIPAHHRLYVAPEGNVIDFVEAVANFQAEKPRGWGGSRPRCVNHPEADVIKSTTWHCAECGELLRTATETIKAEPQDAGLLEEEFAATGTDGNSPYRASHHVAVLNTQDRAAYHNNTQQVDQAWSAWGRRDGPPIDRYTDVTGG